MRTATIVIGRAMLAQRERKNVIVMPPAVIGETDGGAVRTANDYVIV
jgi:hypothetical protein